MNPAVWQARATSWELLALSFRYPDETLAEALVSGEWTAAVNELNEILPLGLPQGWDLDFETYASAPVADVRKQLRIEATRLFVGTHPTLVSPYEGIWRAKKEGVDPLLFVNPHTMDVEHFYHACGLAKPEGTNEPPDHVSTECECLEYLALLIAGLVQPSAENIPEQNLPGGSAVAAYRSFLADHVFTWIPDFVASVHRNSREPFFRVAAQLLQAVLNESLEHADQPEVSKS